MGVYVTLEIEPSRIGHDEWHEVYEESLALLKGFPGEMMGIHREKKYSTERRVYSRRIEHDANDPTERHWHVVGDFKSKELGESFILYYDLNHYLSSYGPPENSENKDEDIIFSLIEENSGYRDVFSEKTQGCPYHIPMLAVAMLVEDRFEKYAHASGDIDIHQAKRAQKYAKTVLDKEIGLPVCVDARRLFERIRQISRGKEAISHFRQIYRGNFYDEIELLCSMSDRPTFTEWFLKDLRYYKSPSQLGAIDLSMAWLNATRDLRALCELACLHENGPKFEPVEFAGALASTWISIDESLRGVTKPFRKPKGEADTVISQFGSIFFDISGLKGRNIRFYLAEEKVLETLAELLPAFARPMEEKFKAKTDEIKKNLAESRQGVEELVRISEEELEFGDGSSFMVLESTDNISPRQEAILEGMVYAIAGMRSRILEEKPKILEGTPGQLVRKIIKTMKYHGPTLTEDAWKWLDNETDRELLQFVLSLATIDNHEQKFWNTRKGMLENRALCKAAFEMSKDEALLAKIEAALKEAKEEVRKT